jgi:hypothetical protein
MSPAIKPIIERVASWPEEDQEELAEIAREIEARRNGLYKATPDELRVLKLANDEIASLITRHLLEKAEHFQIPAPRISIHDGTWVFGEASPVVYLNEEVLAKLRTSAKQSSRYDAFAEKRHVLTRAIH